MPHEGIREAEITFPGLQVRGEGKKEIYPCEQKKKSQYTQTLLLTGRIPFNRLSMALSRFSL